jgi:hypothetical protein
MPRNIKPIDTLINGAQRIDLNESDKIIAVVLKNLGTAILKTGINAEPVNETITYATQPYGNIQDHYLSGYLKVDFDSSGTQRAVATIYKDMGEAKC